MSSADRPVGWQRRLAAAAVAALTAGAVSSCHGTLVAGSGGDAPVVDAIAPDPGRADAGLADALLPDAAALDAAPPDAAGPDAAWPDPEPGILRYRVTFESGSTAASPGQSMEELKSGGTITAVRNPHQDDDNPSAWVGHHQVPAGYTRAELTSQPLPIVDKVYTYKWSYFIPPSFFAGTISWDAISQFKTWPCGASDGYSAQICGRGGIFDHVLAKTTGFEFDFRAVPDCYVASPAMETGRWVRFVMEIRWSNGSTGYVKLWKNNSLVYERYGFKTLFDDFQPGTCDMHFAVGIYTDSSGLELYTDDLEIWEGP